jgi:putative transcriptional regulator
MENRIRELREGRGLSQEDLAARVEVSRQTIISLEKGRYDPSIRLARRLAVAFGTTIENLFVFEE